MTDDSKATREQRWQERLAVPVLVAALVSIPAIFLTFLSEPWSDAGRVINLLSGLVLVGETLILFLVTPDKKSWFKRHLWLIVLTVLVIIGVIFALGPVQLFRIIRLVGALRILRTGRIIKAGRLLSGRISGRWNQLAALGVSILVAIFVAATLADPTSTVREILRGVLPFDFGPIAVIASGLILAGATFIVLFDRNSKDELDAEPGNDGGQS
ncbi:MAG: hypothetical protein ACTIB7_13620 [Brevibacterium aurantiacum]|uniref:Uncharacterized protein n=1 Tax=Brevibacterium antiquum TaxID=234835 RepID=A0A2H1JDF0_9MICO|nr:hypothetical protein [Brevibacterium antiquum]MDN5595170.1 hypothetical protein [Brevibacterium sp.]SMX85443.1 hypothetical protein BANT10_01887 [Brevibacterium antiquum]